ncbi:hypothetical protein XENTR_v10022964 [Xenopus tropicalis]|nr:hypothetical protein XENTR_v10022964 [Xenopus tropicalis]
MLMMSLFTLSVQCLLKCNQSFPFLIIKSPLIVMCWCAPSSIGLPGTPSGVCGIYCVVWLPPLESFGAFECCW